MPRFPRSLFSQVVLALLVGVFIGLAAPEFAVKGNAEQDHRDGAWDVEGR